MSNSLSQSFEVSPSTGEPPRTSAPIDTAKPKLRGIPDVVALFIFVPAALALMVLARPGLPMLAAIVYGVSLILLFLVSASYHAPMWSPQKLEFWKKLDHSTIYVMIAGGYTPPCLVVLEPAVGLPLLAAVWGIAAFGALKSFFWVGAPRWLTTLVYLGMGWLMLPQVNNLLERIGLFDVALVGLGGVFYSIGAACYALRRPNFWPGIFGYHEVFHVFIIIAAAFHYYVFFGVLT